MLALIERYEKRFQQEQNSGTAAESNPEFADLTFEGQQAEEEAKSSRGRVLTQIIEEVTKMYGGEESEDEDAAATGNGSTTSLESQGMLHRRAAS